LKLSRLTEVLDVKRSLNFRDIDIKGISTDSRRVEEGYLFCAVKGTNTDGHFYIDDAIQNGAVAIVVEDEVQRDVPVVVVEDSHEATALLARLYYDEPSSKLVLCGVTGTNGKTSTSFLLSSILNESIGPSGIIGTVGFGFEDSLVAGTHTTPASVELFRILSDFIEKGCRSVVMEVSSHATTQKRIVGLEFDIGIFTNITRDHLDYHRTMKNYIEAKEMFAKTLLDLSRSKGPGILVYNMDDKNVRGIAERFDGKKISFGTASEADVRAEDVETTLEGTKFTLIIDGEKVSIHLKLLGSFSVFNSLAASAGAKALGIEIEKIKRGLERVIRIPGRFQVVSHGEGPVVIVDYAHTPDALERLLNFCRELSPGKIITVFGCGGDRDRGKRPIMGEIASRLSDLVFVTDDNPRTEDPDRIIEEILSGIPSGKEYVRVERDRREAIFSAVSKADEGDLVVIAGKGHETEQIIGRNRIHFNDVEVAEEALKVLKGEGKD